jgi:hypothetical protein
MKEIENRKEKRRKQNKNENGPRDPIRPSRERNPQPT